MSAKVIPFSGPKKKIEQIVEEAVDTNLSHMNPRVLACLKKEVTKLVEKHFSSESPEMTILLPSDLTETQYQLIKKNFNQIFNEHNERMLQRSNAIFLDLYLSRLELCELKHGHEEL